MNGKRILTIFLSALLILPTLATFTGCGQNEEIRLRIYSWEEYIDEGGEGSYVYDEEHKDDPEDPSMISEDYKAWYEDACGIPLETEDTLSMIDDFELWYEKTYGTPIRVEYSTFGTNEDMYNQLKLGDAYDLICPSEYMIMKLAAENMLETYSDSFFDKNVATNYYVNNVSPFIQNVFESNTLTVTDEKGEKTEHKWSDYAAGYMWGITGLIYNPEMVNTDDLHHWDVMLDQTYSNQVTTKDNARDSYFVGIAIAYQDELLALKEQHALGTLTNEEYTLRVTQIMNRAEAEDVAKAQQVLLEMKENIYGFETDTGKSDMVKGTISMNFAWSGDAVYAIDLAEEEEVYLEYFVPEECANMYFDGWVMPKGAQKQAAEAFVNFVSMPYNAIRNMYYIGYTSAIATDEVFEFADYMYGSEEDGAQEYDLSYFFGEDHVLYVDEDQLTRQLYAQYPPESVMLRCAVMDYFDEETNTRVNDMWAKIKGASLDAWAIIVICVSVVAISAFIIFVKIGGKIDLFRKKPKKGYVLVKQEPYKYDN